MRTSPRSGRFVAVAAVLWSATAWAIHPASLPAHTLRTHLAQALGVPVDRVSDVRAYDVARGTIGGFVLGRHRDPGSAWAFPAVALYAPCRRGFCVWTARLGAAARRLAPVAVVDLDAPRTELGGLHERWRARDVPVPTGRLRRPALVLVVERDGPRGDTTVDLVVVAIGTPKKPRVLGAIPLVRRSPEPRSGPPMPSTAIVGYRVDRVAFTHAQGQRAVVAATTPLLPHTSGCPAPRPRDRTYPLTGDRYREPAEPLRRSGGCP